MIILIECVGSIGYEEKKAQGGEKGYNRQEDVTWRSVHTYIPLSMNSWTLRLYKVKTIRNGD